MQMSSSSAPAIARGHSYSSCLTITYGDQAENHVGMQKIGTGAEIGISISELNTAKKKLEADGCVCELVRLDSVAHEAGEGSASGAAVLILRDGVSFLLKELGKTAHDAYQEQMALPKDKKAKMYGRVVDKMARHNLCFSDAAQEPDYESGKGRIVAFDSVPLAQHIRRIIPKYFGPKVADLQAEGNYYYDLSKCGIGFHGDAERKIVVAFRLGAAIPLHYQWFRDSKPLGKRIVLSLRHGDVYVMSDKAVGYDWKKKKVATLRHAAGCAKFLKIDGFTSGQVLGSELIDDTPSGAASSSSEVLNSSSSIQQQREKHELEEKKEDKDEGKGKRQKVD